MSDRFTTTTQESWFSRLGNSLKGILFGFILFLGAFPLLFWNEGRSVETYKTLQEGGKQVISLSTHKVSAENDGRLVHLSGKAETQAVLQDPDFNISGNGIKLIRQVEMYQWKETSRSETKKEVGGGTTTETTYSYKTGWSEQLISSAHFAQPQGHQNPPQMPYQNQQWSANRVNLGEFQLSRSLISQINRSEPLTIQQLPQSGLNQPIQSIAHGFYWGRNPSQPQIGDMRITYQIVPTGNISIIAKQVNNQLQAYQTKAGGSIEILKQRLVSAQEMIQQAQTENTILTWVLRVVGVLIMFFGLKMIFSVISVTADVLPILGNIAEFGLNIVAFLIALTFSLLTIAIAWIFYRPLLAGSLIAVALGVIFWVKKGAKKVTPEMVTEAAAGHHSTSANAPPTPPEKAPLEKAPPSSSPPPPPPH